MMRAPSSSGEFGGRGSMSRVSHSEARSVAGITGGSASHGRPGRDTPGMQSSREPKVNTPSRGIDAGQPKAGYARQPTK